jgi:hypothetical protein
MPDVNHVLLSELHPNDREKIEQSIVTNERHRIFPKATRNKTVRHVDKERESGGKIVLSGLRNDTFPFGHGRPEAGTLPRVVEGEVREDLPDDRGIVQRGDHA